DLQHCAHRLLSYPNDPAGALEAKDEFTHVLGPLVTQRRVEPRHDLISTLATTNDDGDALTDEAIFTFVRLLFAAGTDTTFHALGALLERLSDLTLLDRDATRIHGTVLRGPRQLKVRWA